MHTPTQMRIKICAYIGGLLKKKIFIKRYRYRYLSLSSSNYDIGFGRILEKQVEILESKKVIKTHKKASIVKLQTIGSGAPGSPKSLYVTTLSDGFLFNCGEGTTRIACEVQGIISAISGIFVTTCSWENVSGITCMREFCYSRTKQKRRIITYGPVGLIPLMKAFNIRRETEDSDRFMKYSGIENDVLELDAGITIKCVALEVSSDDNGFRISERHSEYWRAEYSNRKKYVLAYICTPSSFTGMATRNLLRKGVPRGHFMQQLRKGETVKLEDGRVVTHEEISVEVYSGGTFIVIEIPNTDYLDSLASSQAFESYQSGRKTEEDTLEVIVHFSPSEVMRDPRYLQWVNSFSPSVTHIVLNDRNTCVGLQQSLKLQVMLNHLQPRIFPMVHEPNFSSNGKENSEERLPNPQTLTGEYQFGGPTIQAQSHLQYYIRPRWEFDSSLCPNVIPAKLLSSCMSRDVVVEAFKEMNTVFKGLRQEHPARATFPSFVFLGTGSTYPSPKRNASSILVHLSSTQSILLECGEGSVNQLIRLMGKIKAQEILRQLVMVYSSHHHFDHFLGLPSLLVEREKAFKEIGKKPHTLHLLVCTNVLNYLKNINRTHRILRNVTLVNNSNLDREGRFMSTLHDSITDLLRLKELMIFTVPHCKESFGISFTTAEGAKITYSGDTLPSRELVEVGMDSDLLIHEATYEEGMEREAKARKHCTLPQAVQVARRMKAKFTILTHFSQRYQLVPPIEGGCPENVGIAFDNMKVSLEDLPYLPYLYPTFEKLFSLQLGKVRERKIRREL